MTEEMQELPAASRVDQVARAICAEQCAYFGEPPCWALPSAWPNPDCNEPGCVGLAAAVMLAVAL